MALLCHDASIEDILIYDVFITKSTLAKEKIHSDYEINEYPHSKKCMVMHSAILKAIQTLTPSLLLMKI